MIIYANTLINLLDFCYWFYFLCENKFNRIYMFIRIVIMGKRSFHALGSGLTPSGKGEKENPTKAGISPLRLQTAQHRTNFVRASLPC
ncbi:MAG: hypothetical protein K2O14_07045, partial [Oscillospiraceae bacterium]|nr:hypothetical protein [Oscillospiraceae bacterium]